MIEKLTGNGPAIWGGCVTRRNSGRSPVLVLWQKVSFGRKRRVWRTFCRHSTNFIVCWRDRGTNLIGAANLSPVTKLVAGTGAVSRYNLSRSQKFITVQNLNCMQMCESGCMNHYKFVLSAGAEAKSVTNNLPILSVLARVVFKIVQLRKLFVL